MAAQGVRKTVGGSLELTICSAYTNGSSRGASSNVMTASPQFSTFVRKIALIQALSTFLACHSDESTRPHTVRAIAVSQRPGMPCVPLQ